jgi:site-specific DNA recombinase
MKTPATGPASFGFLRKDGKLVAHSDEAPIRRRVFELFLEHKRKKIVAQILNAEGSKTRNGAEFTGQTIGRLLQEERVTGVKDDVAALVTQDLFDRCAAILDSQNRDGGAARKPIHLFAGYVFCACGSKMYVPSNSEKYICSECRQKIPEDDLEAIVLNQFREIELGTSITNAFQKTLLSWSTHSFETKREIVESLTDHIEIDSKKVTCFLLSFPERVA